MKNRYVSPRCQSEKIDFTSLIAASIGGGSEGYNGDEGEVRQENRYNTDVASSSLWDNEW